MKKLLIIPTLLMVLASCNKDLSNLNIDTKHASTAPSYTLFSNGVRNLADYMATPNVNTNVFQLITQQWTEVTYTDESNYDLGTRAIPDRWWRGMYKQALINFQTAKDLIPTDVTDPGQQKNELAITDIMQVFTWSVLVNTFGDIPYTEALDPDNLFPKYDDAKTVYFDLLTRLDTSIAALDPAASGFGSDADLVYGGDVEKWIMFGNSLKLRLGMIIADFDAAKSKSVVESAAPNVFTSNTDNASFAYTAITPNVNPVWGELVQSGRDDYAPATTLINLMNTLNDTRRPFYFNDVDGKYVGGQPGAASAGPTIARPSTKVAQPDLPYLFLSYAEVEFALAEAVERGYNVGGTAAEHYTNGVTASMEYWGVSSANIAAYLAQPSVAYATATGDYKQKIGTQKYLALYMDGFDAWTEIRRLDFPKLAVPVDAQSGFPVRYPYPVNEQNLNSASWSSAAAAIGGDKVETKLFWDKF